MVSDAGRERVCRALSVSQKSVLQVVQPATLRARPLGALPDLEPAVVCRRFYLGLLLGETQGMVLVCGEATGLRGQHPESIELGPFQAQTQFGGSSKLFLLLEGSGVTGATVMLSPTALMTAVMLNNI